MAHQAEAEMLKKFLGLMPRYDKPLLVCSYFTERESPSIEMLVTEGHRIYNDVEDAATILASLCAYYSRRYRMD